MTSSPPDEALHFRGKTLTPESPRPVHIPEPSSIPVLENQMDPVFNDTATYELSQTHGLPHDAPRLSLKAPDAGPHQPQLSKAYANGSVPENEQPGGVNILESLGLGNQAAGSLAGSLHVDGTEEHNRSAFPPVHNALSSNSLPSVVPDALSQDPVDPALNAAHVPSNNVLPENSIPSLSVPNASLPASSTVHPNQGKPGPGIASADQQLGEGTSANAEGENDDRNASDGVNFQSILDNLAASANTAPSAQAVTATVTSPSGEPNLLKTNSENALASHVGLPPRPPPQDKPAMHPNYDSVEDIRSFHQLPAQTPYANPGYGTQPSNSGASTALSPKRGVPGAPGTESSPNDLPPPPVATFQQATASGTKRSRSPGTSTNQNGRTPTHSRKTSATEGEDEAPWGPEVQKKYDEFLHDERIYVTEGLWDRFPAGSRLFIGNLPTERVTKRDLFHLFHKYGKLAQISIKQAYGFVQFLDNNACGKALQAEQGGMVRGRKIHLEISKPQRNTRPAPAESGRAPPPRRSRSPEHSRGGPSGRGPRAPSSRYDRAYDGGRVPFSDFRDDAPRRRDDYRPHRSPRSRSRSRSPSPRGFHGRDGYRSRDRTPERYDRRDRRRSRSPYSKGRYRTPSPRARGYDSDSDLPIPRRSPREVPDIQIIVLDDVDRNFVHHIENAFRDRGLRSDVLILSPRIPLAAVVRRQILEGVLAVVKLSRSHQYSGKVPLQVFDRSGGSDDVRFNEYAELDLKIAAEIVINTQMKMRNRAPALYPAAQPFVQPQFPPHTQAPGIPALAANPNLANLLTSLDQPGLQSLLGALQQNPVPPTQHGQYPTSNNHNAADLAALLSSMNRQPGMPQAIPTAPPQHNPGPPFGLSIPGQPIPGNANLAALLGNGLRGQPQQPVAGPHVQNIMEQLTKWKH